MVVDSSEVRRCLEQLAGVSEVSLKQVVRHRFGEQGCACLVDGRLLELDVPARIPSLIDVKDSLLADTGRRYSVVLSNPPFGRKSSITVVGADGREAREDREIERADFVVATANKQLNFLQHIATILKINGARPLYCRTTCSSRSARARPSAGGC